MTFSGGVRLGDLDDFLGPAQDCIAPLMVADGKVQVSSTTNTASTDPVEDGNKTRSAGIIKPSIIEPSPIEVVRPNLIKKTADEKATVSLSDCLACSGCVTSAETVLLQEQSTDEFIRRCRGGNGNGNKVCLLKIVSISPESLVSLAHHFNLTSWACIRRLSFVFQKHYGVDFVCDMSAACAISLWERQRLMDEAEREKENLNYEASSKARMVGEKKEEILASMSSTCPGWTLYAEKVCDPSVLPHISLARSPQHVQGSLIKRIFAPLCARLSSSTTESHASMRSLFSPTYRLPGSGHLLWWDRKRAPPRKEHDNQKGDVEITKKIDNDSDEVGKKEGDVEITKKLLVVKESEFSVYHVLIAPCFDRKIEAVRPQYETGEHGREVDTVLATSEVLDLLPPSFGGDDNAPTAAACGDDAHPRDSEEGEVYNAWNLRSLEELPRPKEFWDILGEEEDLEWKEIRNDLNEVLVKDKNSSELVKYVRAYGFKNIQNAIRRVKAKGKLRNIEVMACPSACLNGGGQIATPGMDTKERVERLRKLWPSGKLPQEAQLWELYKAQPVEWWRTDFRSLKGASIRW